MQIRALALLALGIVALTIPPASAQTSTSNALREWGLLGWWSLNCGQPVSQNNTYYGYLADADGRAWQERDFGNAAQNDRSQITTAEIRPDGTISITVNFTSISSVRTILFVKEGAKIRAIYNRGSAGDVTVENGVFKHNGQRTPWQYKCREAS